MDQDYVVLVDDHALFGACDVDFCFFGPVGGVDFLDAAFFVVDEDDVSLAV